MPAAATSVPTAGTGGATGEESILRYNNYCERLLLPMLSRFANPARFMRFSGATLPWCAWASLAIVAIGLYLALIAAPPDYQQGEAVRIMYVHVPAAWLALSSICLSRWRAASPWSGAIRWPTSRRGRPAPIGAAFTFLCLVTGSLWGRPMWGT